MLKSMTAFGRACVSSSLGRFSAEIQSVNRKHLEIVTNLPAELIRFDTDIKKWIAAQVARGNVSIRITACFENESPLIVTPNIPLARQIKAAWDKIAEELRLDQGFKLSMLAKEQGVLLYDEDLKEEEKYRAILKEVIDSALIHLVEMKISEGKVLQGDIAGRLQAMREPMEQISVKAPGATEKYRQKLKSRLEEILPGLIENEERILREISVFAEKIDISEEITRFNSHLLQFEDLLNKDSRGVGKTLEFLIQELNREINTIGSKASDVEITKNVIGIKSELEKVREQIQNIE